ncbi:Translocase inner membrane subunit 44-2 isoform 1 [Hibiscus syriacus]|uniref:Translocase inner membrane subunit 44-2 isoform 1 n=1 Tax=Hibiscus syriacus TaxID=106335 RepID=A0A6A2Y0Y0_HIBSY|nr:Translocase inner membrane subunit 44-2 isoform 1 [Hibiscus syriacus]
MGAFMAFNGRHVPGDALSTRGSRVSEGASPGMRLPHVASNSVKTRVKRVPGDAPFASSAERFWSSRREAWPRKVPRGSMVRNLFGSRASERYGSDMILMESRAVTKEGDVFNELLKQASAALHNSYARKGFPYTAWEVKTLMIQGLVTEGAAARLTKRFSVANDACI